LRNEFVLDLPIRFPDQIGKENGLDLVDQEYFGDGLEYLVDGIPKGNSAGAGDGFEDRHN
jgi:hypothetical protein